MPILNSRFYARTGEDKPAHSQRGLELRGQIVAVHISPPQVVLQQLANAGEQPVTPIEGQALIDTGASKTSVDKSVVEALGLPPIGQGQMGTAGGMVANVTIHAVQLTFPTMPGSPIVAGAMMACDLSGQPFQVLFGRDLLARFIFIMNGPDGSFSLAY